MKKSELLQRLIALEAQVAMLQAQVVAQRAAPVNPWVQPFPNRPPYISPTTTPQWPTILPTVCEVARAN